MQIFRQTGLNVRLGTLSPGITEPQPIELPDGTQLVVEPLVRSANGRRLGLKDFDPCTILLNNDLSAGIPPMLENCTSKAAAAAARRLGAAPQEQPLRRLRRGGEEVRQADRVDPWMLNPLFAKVSDIDFQERTGEDALADSVSRCCRRSQEVQGIRHQGTALRGRQGRCRHLRHGHHDRQGCQRDQGPEPQAAHKMMAVKEGLEVSDVIMQEGVHTFERINEAVAEPVVYMIDRYVVGGFYRVHADRGIDENLNAPGRISCRWPSPSSTPCRTCTPSRARPRRTASTCMAWWRAWRCWRRRWKWKRPTPTRKFINIGPAPGPTGPKLHENRFPRRSAGDLQDLQGFHLRHDARGRARGHASTPSSRATWRWKAAW
jgi:glutamate--cysteine ligase